MPNFKTIQKLAKDVGIDETYLRKMIRNNDLIAYKKDGYKRLYINMDEFNSTIKAIGFVDEKIDLDDYLV